MQISYFQRKSMGFHFSIEKLFNGLRENLPNRIEWQSHIMPFYSMGLLSRLANALFCTFHQGDINHIEGDVHYVSLFLRKKKTLNTFHDFTFLQNSAGLKHLLLKLFWVSLPLKRSVFVTTISEATKAELIKLTNCAPEKIVVIPNLLTTKLTHIPRAFNRNCPTILHIGTTPNKNLERLAMALKDIPCKLIVIGQFSAEQSSALCQNNIYYENFYNISEQALIDQYTRCDMVSFCSLNEGFGLPILEAQAIGRVLITSNISSMPEVAGAGALLIDPYSVEDMRAGIIRLIENAPIRDELIEKGFENIKRFSSTVVTCQYVELYDKINALNRR